MKKRFFGAGIILGLLAAVLAGCEKKAPPAAELEIATGGSGGTYYAYGLALGRILENNLGLPVTVRTTAASVANIALIQSGAVDMAFVQNDIMTYAYNGTNLFSAEGPQKDFSVVAGLYPEVCHIIAAQDIDAVTDLKGRRVSVGESGSGTSLNALQILELYGMSFSDFKAAYLNFGDSARALAEGQIDAFFCTAGTPTPAVAELAASVPVRALPISEARRRRLIEEYPFYTAYTLPAGTYAGIDGDVNTVAVRATLVAGNQVHPEDVYRITKALFENTAAITAAHPQGAELNTAAAVRGIPVPFHRGALRYYREQKALP
jgi:TRAP transporter TAXI family solute receptor